MSLKSQGYKEEDREHFRAIYREQQRRYRKRTQIYERRSWTLEECKMVLEHSIPDVELSKNLKRYYNVLAIKFNKENPYLYYNLGCAYLRSGQVKKAKTAFNAAVKKFMRYKLKNKTDTE